MTGQCFVNEAVSPKMLDMMRHMTEEPGGAPYRLCPPFSDSKVACRLHLTQERYSSNLELAVATSAGKLKHQRCVAVVL